jgi:hypothetical protein
MFSHLYKDPKFVGATTSPPNTVMVITEDGIEYYKSNVLFRSTAMIDKLSKEVKGTARGKEKITQLFVVPTTRQKGRFTVTEYEL